MPFNFIFQIAIDKKEQFCFNSESCHVYHTSLKSAIHTAKYFFTAKNF